MICIVPKNQYDYNDHFIIFLWHSTGTKWILLAMICFGRNRVPPLITMLQRPSLLHSSAVIEEKNLSSKERKESQLWCPHERELCSCFNFEVAYVILKWSLFPSFKGEHLEPDTDNPANTPISPPLSSHMVGWNIWFTHIPTLNR